MANKFSIWLEELTGYKKFWTHWQWYRSFFGEGVFKVLVSFITFLPVIAKIFQSDTSAQGNAQTVIETKLKGLFNWELLWFSAISYLIAFLLYYFFCPKVIKTYTSYKEYRDFQHSPRWLVWLSENIIYNEKQAQKFIERLRTKKYFIQDKSATGSLLPNGRKTDIQVREKQTVLAFIFNGQYIEFGMPLIDASGKIDKDATTIAEQEIFWEIFGRYASSHSLVRGVIICLLAFSLIMFATVILQYLGSMIYYIFR